MNIKAASQRGAADGHIRSEFHQSAAKWERGDDFSLYCAFLLLISIFELGLHTGKYADSGEKKNSRGREVFGYDFGPLPKTDSTLGQLLSI